MHEERRFPVWVQFACVAGYFGTDLFLRFSYQAVLEGDQKNQQYDDANGAQTYAKPTFMVLAGYILFFFWGPLLVWPYLIFHKKVSVIDYYNTTWSGDLTFRDAFRYTCIMGCILFLGNLGYIAGLRYINVALASALSQGEAPFTVVLSYLFLQRVFGQNEKMGILLSFSGIAMIAIPPVLRAKNSSQYYGYDGNIMSSDELNEIAGIFSTLFGAFGFGCFQVFWPMFDGRRYSALNPAPSNPLDAIIDTFATLSLVGAFLLSTGWIVLLLFHVLGWESFEVPPVGIRGALLFSTILTAIVDALNGIACVIASAMVVALSYPLIIPLSVVMQAFIDGIPISDWGVLGWIGTALVVAGVFCLESNPDLDQREAVTDQENGAPYVNAPNSDGDTYRERHSWTESRGYLALEEVGVFFTCGRRKL